MLTAFVTQRIVLRKEDYPLRCNYSLFTLKPVSPYCPILMEILFTIYVKEPVRALVAKTATMSIVAIPETRIVWPTTTTRFTTFSVAPRRNVGASTITKLASLVKYWWT
jgi:hypothetical protein